jgi:hypothetical protein
MVKPSKTMVKTMAKTIYIYNHIKSPEITCKTYKTMVNRTAMNSNVLTRRQPVFPLVVVGRDFAPVGGPYGGGSVVMFSWDLEWVYMGLYMVIIRHYGLHHGLHLLL